ncbi:hypothetical protein FCV25MIE_29337 [Fagus crenata]
MLGRLGLLVEFGLVRICFDGLSFQWVVWVGTGWGVKLEVVHLRRGRGTLLDLLERLGFLVEIGLGGTLWWTRLSMGELGRDPFGSVPGGDDSLWSCESVMISARGKVPPAIFVSTNVPETVFDVPRSLFCLVPFTCRSCSLPAVVLFKGLGSGTFGLDADGSVASAGALLSVSGGLSYIPGSVRSLSVFSQGP